MVALLCRLQHFVFSLLLCINKHAHSGVVRGLVHCLQPICHACACMHACMQACTRHKVVEFLNAHTAYELIPESGKVVIIDIDYPVRQAFHALHKQSISSAPLWDSTEQTIVGMISASDFIETLRKLREVAGSGGGALSDAEMDAHTIRAMREAAAADGNEPRQLIFCREGDSFSTVRPFHPISAS
jgi:hypothetical protein